MTPTEIYVAGYEEYINNNDDYGDFPQFDNINQLWLYIRGYIENSLSIEFSTKFKNIPILVIDTYNNKLMTKLDTITNIPYIIESNCIKLYGTNCIDFLGKLYNYDYEFDINKEVYVRYGIKVSKEVYNKFQNLIGMSYNEIDTCGFYKTDPNAVTPTKGNFSDVGYDLTIIKVFKQINNTTTLYDTGIKVFPKFGYYSEIVPRSSLSKSGYMLANSIGIIELSYLGNLYIALTKIDKDSPDLELPLNVAN